MTSIKSDIIQIDNRFNQNFRDDSDEWLLVVEKNINISERECDVKRDILTTLNIYFQRVFQNYCQSLFLSLKNFPDIIKKFFKTFENITIIQYRLTLQGRKILKHFFSRTQHYKISSYFLMNYFYIVTILRFNQDHTLWRPLVVRVLGRRSLLGGSPLAPHNINPFIGPSVAIPLVRCRGTLIFADEKKTDRRE